VQIGFNNCVNRVKVINGEYMVQIRKMSEFGSQTIMPTTTSNNYSDSESVPKKIVAPKYNIYQKQAMKLDHQLM